MSCATNKVKSWVVYDAKEKVFIELTHEEFGEMLIDNPLKLVDKKIWDPKKSKVVWIDGLLNSAWFK